MTTQDSGPKECPHAKFVHDLRLSLINLKDFGMKKLFLRVRLTCSVCELPFIFDGPFGFSSSGPTVSDDMTELRVPMQWPLRPDTEKTDTVQ